MSLRWNLTLLFLLCSAVATHAQYATGASFAPLQQWQAALLAHDFEKMRTLYSAQPPFQAVSAGGERISPSEEFDFWQHRIGSTVSGLALDIVESSEPQTGTKKIIYQAEMKLKSSSGPRTSYVTGLQIWQQQGDAWRIAVAGHGEVTRLKQPLKLDPTLYPESVDAKAEIAHALVESKRENKRVLLVFGANWCYDCDVLDLAFHQSDLKPLLDKNFEVIHVDIGRADKNTDVANKYAVPLEKGIPAIAVLDASGKLLYSQRGGEFEHARGLTPEDLIAFLNKWKPTR